MTPDGVDLVDEDDGGRILLRLGEQVAHTARADADEHLDEIGTGDRVEGHICLPRDGTGEQGLTGAGRTVEQYALRDAGTDRLEFGGLLQKVFDLFEFFDRFIGSGHIREGDLGALFGDEFRFGFAELHHPAAPALHAGEQEPEDQADDCEGDDEAE